MIAMAFVNHVNMFPNIKFLNKEKTQKHIQQRKILNIFFFQKDFAILLRKFQKIILNK